MGTFSFFHHRLPSAEELEGCDKIFLTPDVSTWNPHCESSAKNEPSMLNYEGNMSEPRRMLHHVMEPKPIDHEEPTYELNAVSGDIWSETIDLTFDNAFVADHSMVEDCLDQYTSQFAKALNLREEISK